MATATIKVPQSQGSGYLQVTITYSVTNTDTTHKITATKVKYSAVGTGWYFPGSYHVTYDGTTLHTPPQQTLAADKSKSYTISKSVSTTKTHSAQTKKFVYTYLSSVFASITVPAKTSYTVAFNANGGSGAPSSQTKWYGETLPLSSTKPTRTGYTFQNWNTASGGSGTTYASGANYTANAAATLYAQWKANTYTVSYNANGGSGAPASQTKTYGVNLNLSTTKPTRTGYTFAGWNTVSSASTVTYASGATYTGNSALSLYAIWKPVITATLTLSNRCSDSACTVEDENGTYVKASVTWSCPVSVTSSSLSVKSDSGLTIGTYTFTAGTTGSYEAVISGFNSEKSYPITASFSTGSGSGYMAGSASVAKVSSGTVYTLDFKGKSHVGILGSADDDGDVGLAIYTPVVEVRGPGDEGINTYFHAKNLRTGYGCSMGVGSGGINHGLWSDTLNKWLIYGNDLTVFVNGTDMATTSSNSASAILTADDTNANITGGWVKKWGRVVMLSITWTNKAAISVPASGNIGNLTIFTLNLGYRPAWDHVAHSHGDNAGAAWYWVGANGNAQLGACEGTGAARTIAAGTRFDFHTTFLTP